MPFKTLEDLESDKLKDSINEPTVPISSTVSFLGRDFASAMLSRVSNVAISACS